MNTWTVSRVGVLKMKVFQENSPEKIAKNEVALQQVKVSHLHMHTCMCSCLRFSAEFSVFVHLLVSFATLFQAGVNRWTDNIWCAESYVKKKFGVVGKDFWNNLEGVTDDIDNV